MCIFPDHIILFMAHRPQFPYMARSGSLQLEPTHVANAVAAANKRKPITTPAKSPEQVEAEAKSSIPVRQMTPELVLARHELQFGQYRGQTFQWLLQNAVGYAIGLIDSVQKEQQPVVDTPLGVNKRKFCDYALTFADVRDALQLRQVSVAAESRALSTGDEGERLLGFGQYRQMSWRQLFDSPDKQHRSFVRNFVLKKTDCMPGSRLEQFQAYCRRRLEQEASAPPRLELAATVTPRPVIQDSGAPPTLYPEASVPPLPIPPVGLESDSEATDVSDEELLAAVRLVEQGKFQL